MSESTTNRIQALHQWYCEAMGTRLPLHSGVEQLWFYWLKAGYNGPQLRKVIIYLRKEIRANRRNPGSLKLRNLLDPDLFGEDLLLAGHNLSAENKVPALPSDDGTGAALTGRATAAASPQSQISRPDFDSPASKQALEDLRNFKRTLRP